MSSIIDAIADDERMKQKDSQFLPETPYYYYKKNGCKPFVVAFTGCAKSGKDTAAQELISLAGTQHVTSMAFADPLKDIGSIFGFTHEQLYDQSKKEIVDDFWGTTPRKFLQIVGTECFRKQFRDDCWIKLMERRVSNINHNLSKGWGDTPWIVAVTDVRFPNEVECIRNLGGIICRVERPSLNTTGNMYKHASEIYINELDVDFTIVNDSPTICDYMLKCRNIFMTMLKAKKE